MPSRIRTRHRQFCYVSSEKTGKDGENASISVAGSQWSNVLHTDGNIQSTTIDIGLQSRLMFESGRGYKGVIRGSKRL